MSVYEVHLGSWRQGMSYRDLAEHLVNYVSDLGFTHVELLPVMEHPYGPSWGYQVTGYYAPTARFGTPDDFKYLVDRLHQAGIGVILDWVPGHFPRDAFALARFDGLPLYEHPDPRRGDQPDWGTHVFDFGRLEVRNFLVANALYWLEEFHIDGLRVDAVASMLYLDYSRKDGEWIPNVHGGREHLEAIGLLQEANATAYKRVPGIVTIAEESTSWPGVTKATSSGGLGFGLKWNMGWMNDTLRYLKEEPIHRQYHHNLLTFSLMYAFSENYLLPISHDEVVHGKGSLLTKIPGSREEQLATLRAFLAYMWSHPGKQLLFMGCEFAQPGEWADGRSLDWWLLDHAAHYRVHALVKELNRVYREHPAMWALDSQPAGFRWLDADDNTGNVLSYLRFAQPDQQGDVVATVVNYSGDDKAWVRVGVPRPGRWEVVLDTSGFDEASSPSQAGAVLEAEASPWHDQPWSVTVRVAELATLYLAPRADRLTGSTDGMNAPRAGQPAQPSDLVDVAALVTAYYTREPDPENVDEQVAFGTSGHRGLEPEDVVQRGAHPGHDPGDLRVPARRRASTGRCSSAATPTACPSRPGPRRSRCWSPTTSPCSSTRPTATPPRPAVSHAILTANRGKVTGVDGMPAHTGLADGIVVTPSHNPPGDGGFKYNPPHGGPADSDATKVIAARANELIRGRAGGRQAGAVRAGPGRGIRLRLPRHLRRRPAQRARHRGDPRVRAAHRRRPARRRVGRLLGRHRRAARARPHRREPTGRRHLAVHDARLGRQDPDGLLLPVGDGQPDRAARRLRHRHRQRRRRRPARHRHPGCRPAEPQPLPRRRDPVPLRRRAPAVARRRLHRQDPGVELDDRPGRRRPRAGGSSRCRWASSGSCPGCSTGPGPFGGEESAGASFLRHDGSVWTTDKDGILLALLASEIQARTGKSPSEHYRSLVERHGEPAYARIDAAATREEKAKLAALSPDDVTAESLAGEPITAKLTEAPGNGAAIGGLKVVTESAWFAARPSGTEDVYKIYAESFRGPDHLAQVQAEAKEVVSAALGG